MNASAPFIWPLLILTPVLIAVGQVLFKATSTSLVNDDRAFHTVLFNPLFILALAIYGTATLIWIYVLKHVPLSQAYAFMALSFVAVPMLGYLFLGEEPGLRLVLGTGLIVTGLVIIQS